jgi:cell surface protein SprA
MRTTSAVSGVRGPTGFSVFWTTDPFSAASDPDLGPSRMYQLGLVSDPNPASGTLAFRNSFPFVGLHDYRRGLRVPNPSGTYTDNFTQSNTFSIKTNRPLWEGARLDLTWDLRWSVNKNYLITADAAGLQTISSVTSTGQIERSFLMLPGIFPFGLFGTNIEAVDKRYRELLDPGETGNSEKLAQAFEEGLEAVPWLSQVLSGFLPRVNWGFQWNDLQKISFLEGFADRISLEHRYSSNLTQNYRHSQDNGERITEAKRAGYNFSPLLGVTLNFNKLFNGDVSVNTRWGKQKTFELNTSSSNIIEQSTDEFTLQATYRRAGFELPIFGVALKNDVDFSLAFSLNKSNSQIYDVNNLAAGGQPREGTTKTTVEPRVRYSISQRVQSSLFYRYQRTNPDSSVGSRVPGTTIHEGGLELRISITGS